MKPIQNEPDLYDEPPAEYVDRWAAETSHYIATTYRTDTSADELEPVVWHELYAGVDHEDAVVDGVILRGRWTAWAAAAKAGKSTLALYVAVCLACGVDPLTGRPIDPVPVLYLDAEMGRVDLLDRLRDDLHVEAGQLDHLRYVDLVPMLNTPAGAGQVLDFVDRNGVGLVVIDGLNGVVIGPEKDDDTWRPLYSLTIAELKRRAVAVLTLDNLGKDKSLGPRGSSVKLDKADAVVLLERTDNGVRLKATHRRTAAYPHVVDLAATGIDNDDEPILYRYTETAWPSGTAEKARDLDAAGVPAEASNRQARAMLREAGSGVGRSDVLAAAIRYRRTTGYRSTASGNTSGNTLRVIGGEQ